MSKCASAIDRRVGLGDHVIFLFQRRQIANPVGHSAIFNFTIGGFDKTKIVDSRIRGQRRDQTDIRTFRGFDRTNSAIVRRMNVAHFKSRPLASQAAWTEGRQPPLMGNLRKRIGLIHELRQLARTEEFFERGRNRLIVDQLLRHQGFDVLQAHLFFDRPLHAHQADAEMIFHELADGAHPAVAEMIDIVHRAVAVLELHQIAHHLENIFLPKRPLFQGHVELQPVVELQAADFGKIVAVRIEK